MLAVCNRSSLGQFHIITLRLTVDNVQLNLNELTRNFAVQSYFQLTLRKVVIYFFF